MDIEEQRDTWQDIEREVLAAVDAKLEADTWRDDIVVRRESLLAELDEEERLAFRSSVEAERRYQAAVHARWKATR